MESGHLQETLPVFHRSPRTLQEMAASQCALDCWQNVIITRNIRPDEICDDDWLMDSSFRFSCTDIAPFPVGVRSLINHRIRLIGNELHNWFSDSGHPLFELSAGVMVNCIVLNPAACDICYRRTAKNLLAANPAFSLREQFKIACEYCFEEDIERLWFLSKNNNHNFDDQSKGFGGKSLDYVGAMDYWRSKMRGELREFYKNTYQRQEGSPEWFVLTNRRYTNITNWAHIEYFWHKLNREEQSSLVGSILLDEKFTKHLILKLDDEMLGKIMLGILSIYQLCRVIEILAKDELCYELALQVWRYVNVKNIIVENASSRFYETLADFSEIVFQNPNSYGFHVSSLLKEMWLSASIDFKNYVLCNHLEDVFDRSLGFKFNRRFGCDVGFFIELLSGVSLEIRQNIWQSWWSELFLRVQVSDTLELMTLCFNNADGIVQFKKKFMLDHDELINIYRGFIEGEFVDELIEYLKFCCSDDEDEKLVREARRKLALENFDDHINRSYSGPTFRKFLQFFLDSVSSADLAEVLNWEFQDKEANLLSMCISCDRHGLDIFNRALRCFKFPDQRVIELKRFFYERCQYVLMTGDFNSFFVHDWEEFLLWCTFSAENVNRLRDSIAIDDLLENFLVGVHKFFTDCRDTHVVKYRYSDRSVVFLSIDDLLRWYFRDPKGVIVKQFKYDKIYCYENSEAIKMLLSMENDEILRDVLFWFFDHNDYEVIKFLVRFGDENFSWKAVWNLIKSLRIKMG